jgi:thiamine pyrophosphate-dependent acetolactate synthase large subunit-like protein
VSAPLVFTTLAAAQPPGPSVHRLPDAMSAVQAAEAAARVSGEPTLALVSGLLEVRSALPALLGPWSDRVPLVLVTRVGEADLETARTWCRSSCRVCVEVRNAAQLPRAVQEVGALLDLQAPVQVVASDVLQEKDLLQAFEALRVSRTPGCDPRDADVAELARRLGRARRPLLLVGRRAAIELDPARVAALARRLPCPIALTVGASSTPPGVLARWRALDDDLSREGSSVLLPGTNVAWFLAFATATDVLALETTLSEADGFGLESFPLPRGAVWRIGREPLGTADLARPSYRADVEKFVARLERETPAPGGLARWTRRRFVKRCRSWADNVRREVAEQAEQAKGLPGVDPAYAAARVVERRPEGTVCLAEGNGSGMWLWSYLWLQPVVYPSLMANIGLQLAWIHGVTAACPRPAWAVLGDGSLLYQLRLLETLSASGRGGRIAIFVLHNRAWDSIRLEQTFFFESRYTGTSLPPLDLGALAGLFGCEGLRVQTPRQLDAAIEHARTRQDVRPLLVSVEVPCDEIPFAGLGFALAELDYIAGALPDGLLASLWKAARTRTFRRVVSMLGRVLVRRENRITSFFRDFSGWIRGGSHVARVLAALGLRRVFSIPGAQTLSIWDALGKAGIELSVPHSEWNGVLLAEGFAAASETPAVVLNTLGPGIANELVGVCSAVSGKRPVLLVSPTQPQGKRERLGSVFQGIDHRAFYAPHVVTQHEALAANEIESALREALAECRRLQGPVRVDLGFDELFARHVLPDPAPALPGPPRLRREVLCVEGPGFDPAWPARLGFEISAADALEPGWPAPGFGVPFSLGARLADRQPPVVLLTTPQQLLDQLDSIVLARSHELRVQLVQMGTSDTARLAAAARILGAHFWDRPADEELRRIVREPPGAWTIVCS